MMLLGSAGRGILRVQSANVCCKLGQGRPGRVVPQVLITAQHQSLEAICLDIWRRKSVKDRGCLKRGGGIVLDSYIGEAAIPDKSRAWSEARACLLESAWLDSLPRRMSDRYCSLLLGAVPAAESSLS